MKNYQVYVCEYCGKESREKDDILSCEAQHLGLTVEEKMEYNSLKSNVLYWSWVVNQTNNESTNSELDNSIMRLLAFENEHGITAQSGENKIKDQFNLRCRRETTRYDR